MYKILNHFLIPLQKHHNLVSSIYITIKFSCPHYTLVPLKDRIGPASALPAPQPSQSSFPEQLLNSLNRSDFGDLHSRLSDPIPQTTPTNTAENRNSKVISPNISDPAPPYEMYSRPGMNYRLSNVFDTLNRAFRP